MSITREWKQHKGTLVDSVNGFDVIECKTCYFKHIIPIPTDKELENIYREEYYTIEKPLYFKRMEEDIDWWNLVYSDRFETFEKFLGPDRRTLLDVGSGPGYFLLQGKKRGWIVQGIEPSRHAAEYSRKLDLDIIEEFLTPELSKGLRIYDVIHLSEMFEHVPNPIEMLQLLHNLLLPDGLICIVVPNDYNPIQQTLRTVCDFEPWWVAPPHHINYFTHNSLVKLLERIGFEIILSESTFPIDLFLLFGDNYIGNDSVGRSCHKKRKNFELNLNRAHFNDLKRKMYRSFAEAGIGREIVIFGRKLEIR